MEILAEQLLNAVRKAFTKSCEADIIVSGIERTLRKRSVSYEDAEEYAARLGELLAEALRGNITADVLPGGKLTPELAAEILRPLLTGNYEQAADVAARIQTVLNRNAGLGMKGLQADLNTDRMEGIIQKASGYESFEESAWVLDEPVVNFTQNAVDETIRKNADAHFRIGLSPKIKRIVTGSGCKWCRSLAGTYDYPVDREVYRRHERCRCLVLYDPGNGKIQDSHTKIRYDSLREAEKEARIKRAEQIEKERQSDQFIKQIVRRPVTLAERTPAEWLSELEKAGLPVSSLKAGRLKDVPFNEGGGWKANFGDGGIIQYHPGEKSHHQGEYYKISTGKTGKHWYNLKGEEIDVEASREAGKQIIK